MPKESIITIKYNIQGMTCAACAKAVERVTRKLDGVIESNVNLATEKLTITFDSLQLKKEDIKGVIEKAGYKAADINNKDSNIKEEEIKNIWKRFIYSAIFTIPLLIISMGPMIFHMLNIHISDNINPMNYPRFNAIIQLVLTTPVMFFGRKYYINGFKNLFKLSPNMDSLIAIGTSSAYLYSIYSTYQIFIGNTSYELYYESATVILTLITLGKYMEAKSKGKTSEAIKKLIGLVPKTATVIKNKKEEVIPIEEVITGDIVIVKPGEKIPVDGVIIEGSTSIDESMITGESMPVEKTIGNEVIGASINKNGAIKYKTTKVGEDSTLSQIIKLVEEAQGSKAPIAKMADIIAGYFVPVVIIIALLSSIAWLISGESFEFTMQIFISVLVIACPCALGLATPTAIMVGTGKGAEKGILIRNGVSLETTHKIDTIVFDKTGTITKGKPTVTDILVYNNYKKEELLSIAASAEKNSEHPLGEAIVEKAKEEKIKIKETQDFLAITGQGIEVTIDGKKVRLGNDKMCKKYNINIEKESEDANRLADEGKTPMYIVIDNKLEGIIAVADIVKESSKKAIDELRKMGLRVGMISGDNKRTVNAIAKEIGIDYTLSEVLPKDKSEEIRKLQEQGNKVAMVGDGINDAPALAKADVGIAIGSGTDIAMESADIVLMRSDLEDVVTAIKLSKKTIRNIKENLFWAFAYNVIGIPVAMGVLHIFGGPLLNPMIAALAMSFSSVSVVLNALRLRRFS